MAFGRERMVNGQELTGHCPTTRTGLLVLFLVSFSITHHVSIETASLSQARRALAIAPSEDLIWVCFSN